MFQQTLSGQMWQSLLLEFLVFTGLPNFQNHITKNVQVSTQSMRALNHVESEIIFFFWEWNYWPVFYIAVGVWIHFVPTTMTQNIYHWIDFGGNCLAYLIQQNNHVIGTMCAKQSWYWALWQEKEMAIISPNCPCVEFICLLLTQ